MAEQPALTRTPPTRWVTDPSEPTGGYFVDAQGNRLQARDPVTGQQAAPAPNPARTTALNDLVAANWPGWKVLGVPVDATDAEGNALTDADGKPLQLVNLQTPGQQSRQITVRAGAADNTFELVKGPADVPEQRTPQETNENIAKAQADRLRAEAEAKTSEAALRKTQEDEREAQYNQQQGNGYLTHAQLETLRKAQREQQLSAEQTAVQRAAMENNNANTIVSNQIAAHNASTAAANAASTARATEARIRFEQGQLGLDEAKFEYSKSQDEIQQQNTVADRTLKELQQAQTNAVQVQQNALRGQELQQRTAEAAQTAQTQATTAATGAAANVYGTELEAQQQAAQTGAGMLNQRVSAGQGMLSSALNLAGQRPMVGLAPGAGQALMGDIQNFTTQLGGGNAIYDTAARLVQQADPQNGRSPMAQQAFGLLTQVFDRYQQQFNQPHPAVAATAAAQATTQNGAMTAPVTQPVTVPVQPVVQPVAVPQALAAQQSAIASPLPASPIVAPRQGMAALFPGGFRAPGMMG
jgi:hypothetical protein